MAVFSLRRAGVLFCMLIFPLLLLSLAACGSKSVSGPVPDLHPDWYVSLRSEKNILRGVGEGESLAEADAMALADISRQMQVHVKSRIESRTEDTDGSVHRRVAQEVALETSRQIHRADRTYHAPRSGVHYVALEVDLRPDADILAERIRRRWGGEGLSLPETLNLEGPKALTQGEMARRLRQLLTSPEGSGTRSLPLSLSRRDGGWVLGLCSESLPIAEVKGLFDFSVHTSGDMELFMENPSGKRYPNRLHHGDEVVFRMEGPFASGYLSLFNVYPDGRVSLMEDNLGVKGGGARIPEPSGEYFTNAILEPGVAQLDTYVAVLTQRPGSLVRFRHLSDVEGLMEGEGSYGAEVLADFLDRLPEDSAVSVLVVETRP